MSNELPPKVVKAVYPAITTVAGDVSDLTLASNAPTVFELAKIPNKCKITRFYFEVNSAASSTPTDLGTDESTAAASSFASAVAKDTGTHVAANLPLTVDLTDTAEPQSITVQATVTATTAATDGRLRYVIDYLMD